MEAIGHYRFPTYYFLRGHGYEVHVTNPIQSDAVKDLYKHLHFGRSDTDEVSEAVLRLQTLSRTRFAFVDQVSGL